MPNLPGFTANIICEGGALSEYNVEHPDQDPTKATCFVPSIANKTFQIHCDWYVDPNEDLDYILRLRCDGATMCGPYVQHSRGKYMLRHANIMQIDGLKHRREMEFARVQLTEYPSESQDFFPDVGVIQLSVYRAKWNYIQAEGDRVDYSRVFKPIQPGRKIIPLPERSKYLGAHRVTFGNDLGPGRAPDKRIEKLYTDKEPCYQFTFNYRPKALLMAQEIIPRSPSPYISEDRPVYQVEDVASAEDSDEGELEALAAQVRELNQTIARLQSRKRKRGAAKTIRNKEMIKISSD